MIWFEAVICLANTEGGELYLEVEDNGDPTGIHRKHRLLVRIAALIANRTIVHRDYSRLGAVHVRMESNGLVVSQ